MKRDSRVSRREFLETTGKVAAGIALTEALLDDGAFAQTIYTRLNIKALTSHSHPVIAAYERAIVRMRAGTGIPPQNAWLYQANMHGTVERPDQPAWNSCMHGSYYFIAWHRMYLYFFERIVRKISGNAQWAIPFWNYSDPDLSQRLLPVVFRQPANMSTNPLFVATPNRAERANRGDRIPDSTVSLDALNKVPFCSDSTRTALLSFGGYRRPDPIHYGRDFGALENVPHNVIHDWIGGDTGWMGDPNFAARDPIFWIHHSNIDRLWNVWLSRGGGRSSPIRDSWWTDPQNATRYFTFFDENGRSVFMTACQVLRAAQQLQYQYEGEPPQVNQVCPPNRVPTNCSGNAAAREAPERVLARRPEGIRLTGQTASLPIPVPAPALTTARAAASSPSQELRLYLDDIDVPAHPGGFYEVYVGLPAGATPDANGPFFVGSISFFGVAQHAAHAQHDPKEANKPDHHAVFVIDRAVAAASTGTRAAETRIQVTFVPRGDVKRPITVRDVKISAH